MFWWRALTPAAIGLAIAGACAWLFDDTLAARWLAVFLAAHALVQAFYLAGLHHWSGLPGTGAAVHID